jgi:hypothetical protein
MRRCADSGDHTRNANALACSSLRSLFNETIYCGFPLSHLILSSASQGEEFEIIVTLPPYGERMMRWDAKC